MSEMEARAQDIDGLTREGYRPVVAVFRTRWGELRPTSLLAGSALAAFLKWLASQESVCDEQVPADARGWGTIGSDPEFQALREQMEGDGCELFFVALVNDDDHPQVLAHSDIDDLEGFLSCLAAEVEEGEPRDVRQ